MKTRRVGIDYDFGVYIDVGTDFDPVPKPSPAKVLSYWESLLEVEKGKRSFVTVRRIDVNTGKTTVSAATRRGRPARPEPPPMPPPPRYGS